MEKVEKMKRLNFQKPIAFLVDYGGIKNPALAGKHQAGIKTKSNKKVPHKGIESNTKLWKAYLEYQFSLENRILEFSKSEIQLIEDQLELLEYERRTGKTVNVYCHDQSLLKKLRYKFSSDSVFIANCFHIYNPDRKREELYEAYKGVL